MRIDQAAMLQQGKEPLSFFQHVVVKIAFKALRLGLELDQVAVHGLTHTEHGAVSRPVERPRDVAWTVPLVIAMEVILEIPGYQHRRHGVDDVAGPRLLVVKDQNQAWIRLLRHLTDEPDDVPGGGRLGNHGKAGGESHGTKNLDARSYFQNHPPLLRCS